MADLGEALVQSSAQTSAAVHPVHSPAGNPSMHIQAQLHTLLCYCTANDKLLQYNKCHAAQVAMKQYFSTEYT